MQGLKSIGEDLKKEIAKADREERRVENALEALPNEAQCPICMYFDIEHPDVKRIIGARDPSGSLLQMARCKCGIRKQAQEAADQKRIAQANLPGHPVRTLESFHRVDGSEDMEQAVAEFAEGKSPHMLVLQGNYGCGKSHMLEGALRELLHRGMTVRYEVAKRYLDRLRGSYDKGMEDSFKQLCDWYRGIGILALDDVGLEKSSDFAATELTDLVDERLNYGRPTIIATNKTKEQMADHLGERIASRIYMTNESLGAVKLVLCMAEDYRAIVA